MSLAYLGDVRRKYLFGGIEPGDQIDVDEMLAASLLVAVDDNGKRLWALTSEVEPKDKATEGPDDGE